MFRNIRSGKPKIFCVVGLVDSDNTLLGQPLSQENADFLLKICKDTKTEPGTVYFTNIVKCPIEKPKKKNFMDCITNTIQQELSELQPSIVLLFGKDVQKYWSMSPTDFEEFPIYNFPSLNNLKTRSGITELTETFNLIKRIYPE